MRILKVTSALLLLMVLMACARQPQLQFEDEWKLRKDLTSHGIVINQVGETIQIVIPNNQLFNDQSANFSEIGHENLPTLAQLLALYETKQMTITGYDHGTNNLNYNQALALKRAQVLKNYLWRNNVDARLVNTVGKTFPADLAEVRIDFMYLPPIWAR